MGVGPIALTLYTELAKEGFLKSGAFVFELGSQEVFVHGWGDTLRRFCKLLGKPELATLKWESARDLMEALGFHYTSADIDGRFGALRIDLNKPWRSVHLYDVVTNHGTTEHCFDQGECFRTIHNATRVGGVMIHCVPMRGYARHCFYLYQPELFEIMAQANGYEIIRLHVAQDNYARTKAPVLILSYNGTDIDRLAGDLLLCCVMRKTNDAAFVAPIQTLYQGPAR